MRERRWTRWAVTVVAMLAVASAACSEAGDDAAVDPTSAGGRVDADAPADESAADDGGVAEEAEGEAGHDVGGDMTTLPPTRLASSGRRVIQTGELQLEVDDPDETVDRIVEVVERADGFLATADLRRDDQNLLTGSMVVRVPTGRFTEVLRQLEELADRNPVVRIDEEDVTSQSADLEARLRNLTAFEAQLRDLLTEVRDQGGRAEDLLRVFERIREVRAEIEQVQGRLDLLDDQVALATITIRISPTAVAAPIPDPTWQPLETAHDALAATARALSRVADAAIWVVLTILPVLAVLFAPAIAGFIAWRRYGRRKATAEDAGAA